MRPLLLLLNRPAEWRRPLAAVGVSLTVVSAASLLYPWLLKLMVDRVSGGPVPAMSMPILGAALAVVFLVSAVLGYHAQVSTNALGLRLRNTVRLRVFESLLSRPMSEQRIQRVGDLSGRITEDVGRLQALFTTIIAPAYQNLLFIGGCLVLMLTLNAAATLVVTGCIGVCSVLILRFGRRLRALTVKSQEDHARGNALLEESLVGIREVKSFAREGSRLKEYGKFLGAALSVELDAARSQARISQSLYLLLSMLLLGIFFAGTTGSVLHGWTLGAVIAFYFYTYTLVMAVVSTGRIVLSYQSLAGSLERITGLFGRDHVADPPPVQPVIEPIRGRIEFRAVTFSYRPGEPVLERVSFRIPAGSWALLTGASGSGKSTIAHLVVGLDRPEAGEVFVDGIAHADRELAFLRRQIGTVGQEPVLFHGTIADNILWGGGDYGIERLNEVLSICCLTDLVASLPSGLGTQIGERGVALSGGQRARIAIARALISRPPILILDEANALLDRELEEQLWSNLFRERRGKTTLCISHSPMIHPAPDIHLELQAGRITSSSGKRSLVHAAANPW